MNTKPYEKQSVRGKRLWREAAEILNTHPAILKHIYIENYCVGIDAGDFIRIIKRQSQNADEQDKKFLVGVKEKIAACKMTTDEANANEIKDQKFQEEYRDFTDFLDYQLKQLIEVGDEIVSCEDKTFLSGGKYQSAGKRYRILSLDDKRETLTGFTAITTSNIRGERIYWCVHGIRSLWRNGKEIWNWWRAYHDLWLKDNPNSPHIAEMEKQRDVEADKASRGIKNG